MKQSDSWLSHCLKLGVAMAVAGAFYWFGYRQGIESATAAAVEGISPATADSHRAVSSNLASGNEAMQAVGDDIKQAPTNVASPEQNESVADLIDRLAHSLSPAEALAFIKSDALSDQQKEPALRALVLEWIASGCDLSEEEAARWGRRIGSISGQRFGLEVELGLAVAEAQLDPGIARAWMDAYADHPGRSKLFAGLLAEKFQSDPLLVLRESSTWTAWEQKQFEQNLFHNWARKAPEAALDWYAKNRDLIDHDISSEILNTISRADPKRADELLSSIQDPEQRRAAIENIATNLARTGTESAVEWVDSLEDESERTAAMEAVYRATPRGIGAMMSSKDGFPVIMGLVPGGPLEATGLEPGDLVVQAREAEGEPVDLYGMPIGEFVNTLRGEPGSEVEIRVLRKNPQTSQFEERQVRVTREVLIIPPSGNDG